MNRIEELEKELAKEKERVESEIKKQKLEEEGKEYFNKNFKYSYIERFQENYYQVREFCMREFLEDDIKHNEKLIKACEKDYYDLCKIDFEEFKTDFDLVKNEELKK